jgi:hypothetical protein
LGTKLISSAVLAVLLAFLADSTVYGKDTCVTVSGVQVCAEMKGPCDIGYLLSGEKSGLKVDLLFVSVRNKSSGRIKVLPENFYGITERGQVIAIDAPFYESIELKAKLRRKDLAPQESTAGYLFFPSSMGQIRKLVHAADPFMEILLF